jgi:diguanylate cyclase (GGDEF)-like protein/PAS domain S-box-containing protein
VYLPIILSCIYFAKRGFFYSVCLAFLYLLLILLFARETDTDIQAITRSVIFIIVAAVVSSLTAGRRQSAEALKESEEKFRRLFEDSMDAIYIATRDGAFVDVNKAFLELFSLTRDEITRLHVGETYANPADRDILVRTLEERGAIKEFGVRLRTMNGREMDCLVTATARRAPDGSTSWYQGIIRDVTRTKQLENELLVKSITDELTGLYNRRGFFTLAEQQLKVAQRTKRKMTLFFADLDGMKGINDTLGHGEGDGALCEVATVLKETFRKSDIISRMGGDEFAVLGLDIVDDKARDVLIKRLQVSLDVRNTTEGRTYALSLSVGSAHYDPGKPDSLDELIARADTSMYEQKKTGGQSGGRSRASPSRSQRRS